ncbi:MAG: TPM domain-containing protein [Clostridia bacterium]|nr:TPM domain-containing protein [Clostridia bacterium]
MKKGIALILACLFIIALSTSVFADYPKSDTFFYDGAGMLSDEAKTEIKSVNDALFVSNGYRIAVCTVDNTGDIPARTYARGVFGEWKVSGVLILLVKSTDDYCAVQSSVISDVLTDDKLSEILNTSLEPEFSAGNYGAGVAATVKSLAAFIGDNVKKTDAPTQSSGKKSSGWKVFLWIVIIIALLLGGGYGALVYLEKKQERERLIRLEERRRRLAESGRGNYYGSPQRGPADRYNQGYPQQRRPQQSGYPDEQRRQGQNRPDRFVYPDSTPTARPVMRGQYTPRKTAQNNVRTAPPRGQRVDFENEYYRGSASDENVDPSATREFTRH